VGLREIPTGAVVASRVSVGGSENFTGYRFSVDPCSGYQGQLDLVGVARVIGLYASEWGAIRLYKLYCQKPNGKSKRASSTSFGKVCKTGKLRIRTYGYPLRMKLVWKSPATKTFTAFKTKRVFKT